MGKANPDASLEAEASEEEEEVVARSTIVKVEQSLIYCHNLKNQY